MSKSQLVLLLALAGLGAAAAAAVPGPLALGDALLTSSGDQTLVTAPSWALQGTPTGGTHASSPRDCAAACSGNPGCLWANFCAVQVRRRMVPGWPHVHSPADPT